MKTIIEHIGDVVSKAFEECGYDASYAKITISNKIGRASCRERV